MPKRMLDDSLLSSPSIAACSPRAQDAFPRFLLLADDFGCFDANPRVLVGRGWALRADVGEADVSGWLDEFERVGMLQRWADGGRTYAHLLGWDGPHGQRRRDEYDPKHAPKGSKRHTPKPPDASRAGTPREPTGQHDFPARFPLPQSQSQSQVNLAGAVAPAPEAPERAGGAPTPTGQEIAPAVPAQATMLEVGEPPPASKKRKNGANHEADPRRREVSDRLTATYHRVTGRPYVWDGAKDGRALGRLCGMLSTGFTLDDLDARASAAFGARFKAATGLADFAARVNEPAWAAPSTRAEDQYHNPEPGVYRGN